jgi:hypothetical protein
MSKILPYRIIPVDIDHLIEGVTYHFFEREPYTTNIREYRATFDSYPNRYQLDINNATERLPDGVFSKTSHPTFLERRNIIKVEYHGVALPNDLTMPVDINSYFGGKKRSKKSNTKSKTKRRKSRTIRKRK